MGQENILITDKLEAHRAASTLEMYIDTCAALTGEPLRAFELIHGIYQQSGMRDMRCIMPNQSMREQANSGSTKNVVAARAACRLIDPIRPRPGTFFAEFAERMRGPAWVPENEHGENFREYLARTAPLNWIEDHTTSHCHRFVDVLSGNGAGGRQEPGVLHETIMPMIDFIEKHQAQGSHRISQKEDGLEWKKLLQNCGQSMGSAKADRSYNHFRLSLERVRLFAYTMAELLDPDHLKAQGIEDYADFPLINPDTRRIDHSSVLQALRLRTAHANCADSAMEEYVGQIFPKKHDNPFLVVVTDDIKHGERLNEKAASAGVEGRTLVVSTKDLPAYLRWSMEEVKEKAGALPDIEATLGELEKKAHAVETAAAKKFNGGGKTNGRHK